MRLKVTLHEPGAPDRSIQITADATATAGDLAAVLADAEQSRSQRSARGSTLQVRDNRRSRAPLSHQVTLLESGIRSGSTIEVVPRRAIGQQGRGQPVAMLRVIGGPDAGLEVALHQGSTELGRATGCGVQLRDPEVSKRHARIFVGDRIEIFDLNSSNGVVVGGVRVPRVTVGPGDVIALGGTQVSIVALRAAGGLESTSTDIPFVRSPRVVRRPEESTVELPETPRPPRPQRFPWMVMLAPLLMGVALFAMTHNPFSLMFIALSPLLGLAGWFEQGAVARRADALARQTFRAEFARAEAEMLHRQGQERAALESMYPALPDCLAASARVGDLLWSRRPEHPEFLHVRLGTGAIPPMTSFGRRPKGGMPAFDEAVDRLIERGAVLPNAPVVADLRSAGGLGVCGERRAMESVLRGLVTQIVTLHSPAEVILACLTSTRGRERWAWLEWLPHTSSAHSPLVQHLSADVGSGQFLLAHLEELVALRAGRTSGVGDRGPVKTGARRQNPPPVLPSVVVVADEPTVDVARLTRIAERGPDVGVHVLWAAAAQAQLPAACRTFLDVGDGRDIPASVGLVREGSVVSPVSCAGIDLAAATAMARDMSSVVDAGAPIDDESDLPRSVSMVSLFGAAECDDPQVVLTRWQENGTLVPRDGSAPRPRERASDLTARVGHAGTEPFTLDLRAHGPHALVGGTTGSGKSEFLQAWVLALAHANSPDRVTFLFVDYKGGAAFAQCTQLPHSVGLVTDLTPHLVRRALTSLRAELRHREELLREKGAKDLVELEKTGDPDCPPSLVIVVDEFAALVTEVPDFVDGVVDVAQRGRSLGLHLILATQRPAGVIKDNLRANTNLRIALRVADEHDSLDVIGDPRAAHVDPSIPGRGSAKTGPGRIATFQSAFPGARTPARPPAPPIDVMELDFGRGRRWRLPERAAVDPAIPTDIERMVGTVQRAAALGGVPAPRRPWREPLADTYSLESLGQRRDDVLVFGMADDPGAQQQHTVAFRPDLQANLLVVGAGGAGKTTALRTVATAAGITPDSGPTHVYGIDAAGGGLAMLARLPHVGAIVRGDDEERVGRLLRRLEEIVEERSVRYSAVSAATLSEYRAEAGRPDEPRILLLLDGFSAFRTDYEGSAALLTLYLTFLRLLVDGRAVGVHVVLAADRPSGVPTSVAAAFQARLVLRQSDEDAYLAMGVPRDVIGASSPPGRGVYEGLEVQTAVLGADPSVAVQARLVDEVARELAQHHRQTPPGVGALPTLVTAAEMPQSVDGRPVLGIADDTLAPVGFDPEGVFVLAGPLGSGRTSTLRWLAESVHRVHPGTPLVHLAGRRSPLSEMTLFTNSASGVAEVRDLLGQVSAVTAEPALANGPLVGLFIEDLPGFVGTPVDLPLLEVLKACRRNGHLVVVEGESSSWGSPWPLLTDARAARTGVLLQPEQMDGDSLLRTSLPRVRRKDFPAGRGFLIRAGTARKIQIPVVE